MPSRWTSRKFLVSVVAVLLVVVAVVTGQAPAELGVTAGGLLSGAYVAAEAVVDVARAKADREAARG